MFLSRKLSKFLFRICTLCHIVQYVLIFYNDKREEMFLYGKIQMGYRTRHKVQKRL